MNIIIIGCGKVGLTLAELLAAEKHDVVLVDESSQKLSSVPEEIDALRILGNGASINTQIEAGIETADILIAVTGSDELNLLCCLIAKKAGHCHTIARVRNPIYNKELDFIKVKLGISMIINPELTAAIEISRLLRFPFRDQDRHLRKGTGGAAQIPHPLRIRSGRDAHQSDSRTFQQQHPYMRGRTR